MSKLILRTSLGLAFALAAVHGTVSPLTASTPDRSKAPVIAEDPKNVTVKVGEDAKFSVRATGENLTYKWFVNDTAQKDANTPAVKISKVKPEYNGSKIYVVVSNPYGATTSKEAVLTVTSGGQQQPLSISLFRAVPEVIKPGQKARLEAIYTGGQGIITPGGLVIGTNQYIEVSPSNTTTYNLTVTAPNGQRVVANATVSVGNNAKKHQINEDNSNEANQAETSSLTSVAQDY